MALTDYSIDTSGTQADVQRRQKMADALLQSGMDTTPAAGGKYGGWLTALNRGLAGALGGYQTAQANQADQARRKSGQDAANAYLTGMNPAAQGSVPGSLSSAQPPAADAAASGIAPKEGMDPEGKPYTQDQLNPMDEPRGDARKKMIATMLSEEKPGSPEGLGVANVIRSRAIDGGWGNTPDAVVQSPGQFSAWNGPGGQAKVMANLLNPGAVSKANDQVDQAYGVGKYASAGPNDPTLGKTYFYDPASMMPPNSVPKWAQGKEAQQIGKTLFFDDPNDSQTPPNAQMAQGQLPNQQQVMSAGGQPADAQRKAQAARAFQTAINPDVPAVVREMAKADYERLTKPEPVQALGEGYVLQGGVVKRAYEPEDKTPASKLEYDAYVKDEQAGGRKPVPYGQFTGKVDAPASVVPNNGLSGQAFLDTLDPGRAEIIKQMTEGRMAPPTGAALRSDKVMNLMSDAARYDPEFDSTKWGARVAGAKDFASGKSSEMVRSAGQTVHHIDTLIGNMKDLGNTSVKPYNYLKNTANDVMGGAEPNNFLLTSHAVAEELSKVFKGANLSDSEVKTWEHSLSPNMSPEQQKGAIKSAMALLNGSLHMLEEKRTASMGKVAAEKAGPLLKPEEQKIYGNAMKWANGDTAQTDVHPDALAEARRRGLIK